MIIGISGKIGSGKDTVARAIRYLTSNDYKLGFISKHEAELWIRDGKPTPDFPTNEPNGSSWKVKRFAGKLKQIVSLLTGIPVEDLEKEEVKQKVLGEEWSKKTYYTGDTIGAAKGDQLYYFTPYTVRELLQRVGTEAMREIVHSEVWINALFADYTSIKRSKQIRGGLTVTDVNAYYPDWIIPDTRFPNEAKAIIDRGGILIRVTRPGKVETILESEGVTYSGIVASDAQLIASTHPSETALDYYQFDHIVGNDGTVEQLVEKVKQILIKEKLL